MTPTEARALFNHLLTLHIRKEEAFGPLGLAFIRDHNLETLELLPEEQFNLLMAVAEALAQEPKRYNQKLDLLERAQNLLPQTRFNHPDLARQIVFEIKRTQSERDIYDEAMKIPRCQGFEGQRLVIQSEVPDYFLQVAQRRAGAYYQEKYKLSKSARTAQQFSGPSRKFSPDNTQVHKEFPGACGPFMSARTNAFHLMLPFDLKISRKPEDGLEAIMRIFYCKMGYSFPLAYEMGRLISRQDGEVLDIGLEDPHLLFVSASAVKDPEFKAPEMQTSVEVPPQYNYPVAVLERSGSLGPYIQIVTNFKVWFDAAHVSILVQGAPDLHEFGLEGGSGMMTRTHASDKIEAYADALKEPWKENMSFNFVNIHLTLRPGVDTAIVPYNTPLFVMYPVLNTQCCPIQDYRNVAGKG